MGQAKKRGTFEERKAEGREPVRAAKLPKIYRNPLTLTGTGAGKKARSGPAQFMLSNGNALDGTVVLEHVAELGQYRKI